jgi:hypothetical protein
MMKENAILELFLKMISQDKYSAYSWNAIHLLSLHIQVVMKRHPSLGSVGCVDCGTFGENCEKNV